MAYLPVGTPVRSVALDLMQVVLRTAVPPSSLVSALRAAVDRIDPSVPLMRIRTMDEIISASLARIAFTMTLLIIAAVVAPLDFPTQEVYCALLKRLSILSLPKSAGPARKL